MASEAWQSMATGVTYAAAKHMLDVFNASASTRFIRVYRAYAFNNLYVGVTGVLNTHRVNILTTSASGGVTTAPLALDSTQAALNANTTSGSGRTLTVGSIIRQMLTSNDEAPLGSTDWDSLGCLVPYAQIWDAGFISTQIDPIVLAASENRGFSIQSVTQTVGIGDYEICFTNSAT